MDSQSTRLLSRLTSPPSRAMVLSVLPRENMMFRVLEEDDSNSVSTMQAVPPPPAPEATRSSRPNFRRVCIAHHAPTQTNGISVQCTPYVTIIPASSGGDSPTDGLADMIMLFEIADIRQKGPEGAKDYSPGCQPGDQTPRPTKLRRSDSIVRGGP